jgi:beta-lactamase class A
VVLLAIGLIVLAVGCGVATTSDVPASWASALAGHVESGTPGPDAVTAFGAAAAVGGTTLKNLNAPVVGAAATPNGLGYWVVASDGGVFAYGDAAFKGSAGAIHLNAPVVGMAATPDGVGYWLAAADGGVFAYGDAVFAGSMGGHPLNQPIVGMAATPTGNGYWMTAADGGIFAFGDAPFEGSMGARPLNEPVVGMAATPDGGGYWLAAADGGVFSFGDARFEGSDAGTPQQAPAVGIASRSGGYWIAYGSDPGARMIAAIAAYVAGRDDNVTVAVEDLTTGQIFQFRPGVVENTASTLKVDILATLLVEAQAAGRPLTPEEQSLAVPMIEESLDSAADTLWTQLGPAAVGAFERAAGMTSTVPATDGIWGTTTTTALDRLAMIRTLVEPNSHLTDASRAYVLHLMENITPSQDWGATGGVPPGVTVALKNGFAVIDGWQINTTGWVNGAGRDYMIAVLTNGNSSEQYGIDTVNAVSALVWNAFGP